MKKIAYSGIAFLVPVFALAAVDSVQSLGTFVISLINTVAVPLVFALAFIFFIWGVFQYFIMGGANEEARDKGKQLMLYGLIGFFVMISVWGLVRILTGTVDLNTTNPSSSGLPKAANI